MIRCDISAILVQSPLLSGCKAHPLGSSWPGGLTAGYNEVTSGGFSIDIMGIQWESHGDIS